MAAHISQWAEEMHATLGSDPRNLLMKLQLSLPVSEGWVSMFSPESQEVKTEESPSSISLMGGGVLAPPPIKLERNSYSQGSLKTLPTSVALVASITCSWTS